jgi:DNA-binding response OmpR family regulator
MSDIQPRTSILVVEDDPTIGAGVVDLLKGKGFDVRWERDGRTALRVIEEDWSLIILDLNLPEIGGEALLSNLRQRPAYPAVLILTAKNQLEDKLSLFSMGCDDYLTKPFHSEELAARVDALIRRPPRLRTAPLTSSAITLDPVTFTAAANGRSVILTPKEFAFIRELVESAGRVMSRRELLEKVWGLKAEPSANYIGIHLFNLRKKLREIERDQWIRTVKFSGYAFRDPEDV